MTTRRASHGGPVIVKAENEQQEDLLQIVEENGIQAEQNELHVDVIQQGTDGQQQVFLIGINSHLPLLNFDFLISYKLKIYSS